MVHEVFKKGSRSLIKVISDEELDKEPPDNEGGENGAGEGTKGAHESSEGNDPS
jgi:hypothetical protein